MESEPMLTPREKSPLPEIFSSQEDRTHDAASSKTASPTHYQRTISARAPQIKTDVIEITTPAPPPPQKKKKEQQQHKQTIK